jgi:hypothetical protein
MSSNIITNTPSLITRLDVTRNNNDDRFLPHDEFTAVFWKITFGGLT